ncbi:hypothetical protein A4X06_0g3645 [Tilletia controversa]|uniref:Peptidase A2 domain-containing protein n=1 Tax=Tilletia controversa TaxID=13291 RepID=A0A8X7MU24_9BASI|nr:hypothetical protein A4X06_0g3645 [Tilletia controversa]
MRPPPHPPDKDEGTAAARPDSGPEKSVMGGTTTLVSTPPSITHGSGLATAMSTSMNDDAQPSSNTACLHFVDRGIFHVERAMPVNDLSPPLAGVTRRFGDVVALPPTAATGTGTGYRNHVPLTVHIRINGTDSRALPSLLDTGASLSVIDADLLRRLGGSPQGHPMRVQGLGDAKTLGWTTVSVFVDGSNLDGRRVHLEFRQDFHVLPRFAPGLCLGQDFIAAHDVSISPARGRGRIGPYTFPVTERIDGPYGKDVQLVTSADLVIPPGFQAWVPVGAASLVPGVDYAVAPRLSVSDDESVRLAGPTGMMGHQPRAHILLGNYGCAPAHLRLGTVVAVATAARVGDVAAPTSELFELTPASAAPVSDPDSAADAPGADEDLDPGVPLDVFEGTEPTGSSLVQDAATTLVDDAFRIGVDSQGQPPPAVVDLLRRHTSAFALDGRPGRQANAVERSIQTVQKVLQALSVDSRAHWDRRALPAAELAINSSPSLTTGQRPFDLVFVDHPSIVHAVFDNEEHLGVASFPERLAAASCRLEDARAAIVTARREQKRRYDARHAPLPTLQPGDQVFVRLKDRPIPHAIGDKMDSRKLGPFPVEEVLSPHRLRLRLPADVAVDPVFNIEQVDPVPSSPDPFAPHRTRVPDFVDDGLDGVHAGSPPLSGSALESAIDQGLPALDLSAPSILPQPASPIESRARRPPARLDDFVLGTMQPRSDDLAAALRGPLARPRSMVVNGRRVRLVERPVAFISRLTAPAEKKLVASELELSCLAWAHTKFAHLLEGASVTVVTDHSPMEKMLQSQNAVHYGPTISRCRAVLLPHLTNLRFVYRPGPRHNNVDALSRLVTDPGRSASGGGDVLGGPSS